MKLIFKSILLYVLITSSLVNSTAQQKEILDVGIFLYNGVELLDFAGPAEVFSVTNGFRVYSVTIDGKPIEPNTSGKIINQITPDYSLENAPEFDVIVFPGGASSTVENNKQLLDWVRANYKEGSSLLSVCTGAFILCNAGVLKGLKVTTWYGAIPRLRNAIGEDGAVLENTRFIDNGNVITTAGVSAGIDGALYFIARSKGIEIAKATAKYMEYDKWDTDGKHYYINPYIQKLREQLQADGKVDELPNVSGREIPYIGEFENLAKELQEQNKLSEAAFVLQQIVKYYPTFGSTYLELAKINRQIGKPAPKFTDETFSKLIHDGKVKEAFKALEKENKSFPNWVLLTDQTLYDHGTEFLESGDLDSALRCFQIMISYYPNEPFAYLKLGEVFEAMNNNTMAIANYKKCLELKPKMDVATAKIKTLH